MNSTMTMPTQTRRCKSEKRLGPLHEPAAFVDGPNQYQYVGGDPVGAVDPEGLATTQPTTRPTTAPARAPTMLPPGGKIPKIPKRGATEGWAFAGNINFAGPGWAGQFMARPVDTWDFISKVHDLLYEVNGLSIFKTGNADYRSRFAKADYIMRTLHRHPASRSTYGPGMRAFFRSASALNREGEEVNGARCDFRRGDGFINVLRTDVWGLWEVPGKLEDGNEHSYLMIPYDHISRSPKPMKLIRNHDRGGPKYRKVRDYMAPLDEDYTTDWRAWGRANLNLGQGMSSLWNIAEDVTAATNSERPGEKIIP